jgi:O-antigen/teichoic acid export membrane protein
LPDSSQKLKLPDPSSLRKRAGEFLLAVGTEAVDTVTALLSLIIIGRVYGQEGLGVYSFLLAVYLIISYLSESGVGKYLEREVALGEQGVLPHPALVTDAHRAVTLTGFLGSIVVILFGAWHSAKIGMSQGVGPYIFLAAAVYLNTFNTLISSILHGSGKHEIASKLALRKRLVFLGAVFFLSLMRISVPYLVLAFFFTEISVARRGKKQVALPWFKSPVGHLSQTVTAINAGIKDYFTDEALRVVFFLDFLVLGLFVSAVDLGIYSEASVLARLFMIVPVGAGPLFRARFFELASSGDDSALAAESGQTAQKMFFYHSIAGLYFLLYYPYVLRLVFPHDTYDQASFGIFAVLLPGLLYYSAASVLEPVYAAKGRSDRIGKIAIRTFGFNALLNVYLVPYAGYYGAAAATTICLVVYFLYFGSGLEPVFRLPRMHFLLAGGLVYLTYRFVIWTGAVPMIVVPTLPFALYALFYLSGFFTGNVEADRTIQ